MNSDGSLHAQLVYFYAREVILAAPDPWHSEE